MGQAIAPEAFHDDTAGRVLDRLYATGTMKVCTACAVRADQAFHFDKRYVHFDTTSMTVYGEYALPKETEEQKVPFTITYGYSKDKRPDLKHRAIQFSERDCQSSPKRVKGFCST